MKKGRRIFHLNLIKTVKLKWRQAVNIIENCNTLIFECLCMYIYMPTYFSSLICLCTSLCCDSNVTTDTQFMPRVSVCKVNWHQLNSLPLHKGYNDLTDTVVLVSFDLRDTLLNKASLNQRGNKKIRKIVRVPYDILESSVGSQFGVIEDK